MITATAGHIDHGKTLLVKALTGVDADRLPEEKTRGISIDIGFAYWPQPGGGLISFVDLPGHERFVRNMLAGACGIDFALLVVAADDGVMPQTVEHLQILDLLGIRRGLAVITKVDRVASERVAQVRGEVSALLEGTALAGIPVLAVSAVSGWGLDSLRCELSEAARATTSRFAEGRRTRLAIDRAFAVAGSGTVLTGTVFDGELKPGDELLVSPRGTPVRVRGIQLGGQPVASARAGSRCAANVTGIEHKEVHRGHWLLHPGLHAPTQRMDVRLALLASCEAPLTGGARVHLHLGTEEVIARVRTPRGARIAPGTAVAAQLLLEEPIGALHGDRFIIRDSAARRTLGGGMVLDPFAPDANPGRAERASALAALAREDPREALTALLSAPAAVLDTERFSIAFNLTRSAATALYESAGAFVAARGLAIARNESRRISENTEALVREFHRRTPTLAGMPLAELRAQVAPRLPEEVFVGALREAIEAGRLVIRGGTVADPRHDATADPQDEALWNRVLPELLAGRFSPPSVAELAEKLGVEQRGLKDLLYRRAKRGEVRRMSDERFYPRATLAELADKAAALASTPQATFTAAQYRDAIGVGRTQAIRILEFFDGAGITRRVGDARQMRKGYEAVFKAPPH